MAWLPKIKPHLDKIFLLLVLLYIFVRNYSFGTYLTGWDNLMPELNIWMNLKRSFFAVWQEYQGLGLLGGMGHATDLIRQLLILPFTLVLPNSLIRYLWHFFTLGMGTFGIYFGLKKIFSKSKSVPLLASLFYLLNFGTVQNYWVPFEPFSTFFGFFPWLIFPLWDYLQTHTYQHLKKLILFNLLAIPSFYVPTVFVVYLICVFLVYFTYFLIHKKISLKPIFNSFLTIFYLNAFWLLPFLYFAKTGISNPQLAFGNLMATQETFDRNQFRGHLSDFLTFKGYYYDLMDGSQFLMAPWHEYFSHPLVLILVYILAAFAFLGLIRIILNRQNGHKFQKISLILIFFVCATALLSATPPFSYINYLLRQISVLDQIFRSPFTKFIVPTIFCFTLLFASGLDWFFQLISKIKLKFFAYLFPILVGLFIFITSFPVLTGNLIYPQMRQKIPNEYFQLFNYFKSVPSTERIANLPSSNFWGWTNYRFGMRGSGFIWYALNQPVLDRAFDVWNLKNEQYYWELNSAIQKQDQNALQNVFDKYAVSYIVFDNNVFIPDEAIYADLATPTRELLNQMPNLSFVAQYGHTYIYKNHLNTSPFTLNSAPSVLEPGFFYQDQSYTRNGNYITTTQNNLVYPFSDLFTNRLPSEFAYEVKIASDSVSLKKSFNLDQKYDLFSPSNLSVNFSPASGIEVTWPYSQAYTWQNPNQNDPLVHTSDTQKLISEDNQNIARLSSNSRNSNLFPIYFPEPSFEKSYLIQVQYRHISGYPLNLSVFNDTGRHYFFTTKLDTKKDWQTAYFVIPSQNDSFNTGLTLLFNNQSLNGQDSVNDLKSIKVYPLPYQDLINIQLSQNNSLTSSSPQPLSFTSNLFYYKFKLDNTASYLVLPQTYNPGWLAFYSQNGKLQQIPQHVLVDNWANGWQLPPELNSSDTTVYLFYWPQVLEFTGFLLLVWPLCRFFITPSKHNS